MSELGTNFVDKMGRFGGRGLGGTHAGTHSNAHGNAHGPGHGSSGGGGAEGVDRLFDGEGRGEEYDGYGGSQVTLRALVSTKEAGIIIGRQGKNVAELRGANGIKAGVSKVVPNIHDRVLTISGSLDGVSKV